MTMMDDLKGLVGLEGDIKNLRHLFLHALRDMYGAEKQIHKNLQMMEEKSNAGSLRQMFAEHQLATEQQILRLEEVFDQLEEPVEATTCQAVQGLSHETEELLGEAERHMIDAVLVFSAQAVEHYEVARYTALITWADKLQLPKVSKLLRQNLAEELATLQAFDALQQVRREVADERTQTAA